jgi:hypothetical protein
LQNSKDKAAKKAAIYSLLIGYWQMAERLSDELLSGYVNAVEECSADAVARVCKRIASGQAGLNSSFPPTPADIAERAAAIDEAVSERVPLHNGLIEMDWGHGRVDLRGLTTEEQDVLIRGHGMVGGKNAALLDLDEKRASIAAAKQVAPLAAPESGGRIEPRRP